MPELSPVLVVCLAIGIVVVVNAVLIVGFARAKTTRQVEMARDAFKTAQNPWASEDKALTELGRRVSELSVEGEPPPSDD